MAKDAKAAVAILYHLKTNTIATAAFVSLAICVGRQRVVSVARGSIWAGGCRLATRQQKSAGSNSFRW